MCACVAGRTETGKREGVGRENGTKEGAQLGRSPRRRLIPTEESKLPARETKQEEPRSQDVQGLY